MGKRKNRNQFVDIMRGIAMLLVVLQHTMSGCTVGAEDGFVFNVAWSLQMPLFILISGYVTKYSRAISDKKDFGKYVKRRTIGYMLPWAIWSFGVRGIIFGQSGFLNIKNILWNMDSGYWFLATIWTISMIWGIAAFSAEHIGKECVMLRQVVLLTVYLICMALLAGIGTVIGLSFFAIKLTLYYMPFYYIGYLYGQVDIKIQNSEIGKKFVDCVVAACFVIWLFVILRYSLYKMSDGGLGIIMRASTSLAGCIAVCGLCKGIFSDIIGGGILAWIGEHSLEIYLVHYLLLSLIKLEERPVVYSATGIVLVLVNYVITVALAVMLIMVVGKNGVLKFTLTGKKY